MFSRSSLCFIGHLPQLIFTIYNNNNDNNNNNNNNNKNNNNNDNNDLFGISMLHGSSS